MGNSISIHKDKALLVSLLLFAKRQRVSEDSFGLVNSKQRKVTIVRILPQVLSNPLQRRVGGMFDKFCLRGQCVM